jgi:imidazolonepropionase-like amidohydrolase
MAIRKIFLERGYYDGLFSSMEELQGHGYWIVDSKEELEDKWQAIKRGGPDFIKVILSYSEEYEKRKNDTTYFGQKGIDPDILPDLVRVAHRDGYRVTAHVFTINDFSIAVDAGVDEIAHLPGYRIGGLLSEEDVKTAAKDSVVVVTTASLALSEKDSVGYKKLIEDIKRNLKLLNEAGVRIAIGSDTYNDNSTGEVRFLQDLEIFTNEELLKMWCKHSAQTIFPDRKIGELKAGFEANFLVIKGNPLQNSKYTTEILMRVKQGRLITIDK